MGNTAQRAATSIRGLAAHFRAPASYRMSAADRSLLRCPRCGAPLSSHRLTLQCAQGHRFPVVDGVPVFTEVGTRVEKRPLEHQSHQAPPDLVEAFRGYESWLHLGAGATAEVLPGSIELETAIFRHTHLVADVHALPFVDASLGGALALNVFEHLEDPAVAARELFRTVRPGGLVVIQTAFLQPLHADPYHFYNATEEGVRRWFRDFEIHDVRVSENFNPAFAFSWMASDLLHWAGPAEREVLGQLTVQQLSEYWRDPASRAGSGWGAFERLDDQAQRALAAGFELRAHRP